MADNRRMAALVLLLLFPFYLLSASLRIDSGDGATLYQVTRSLMTGGGFAIPPPSPDTTVVDAFGEPIPPERLGGGGPYGAWGIDGQYYAQYGVGQSLLAAPFYLLGLAVYRLTGWGTEEFATRAAVMLLNPLLLALTGGALCALAQQLGYRPGAAAGTALVVGLATPLWVYSKTFFSEPLLALALTVAVWAALREDASGWFTCGTALGIAVLVKPVALAVAPAFPIYAVLVGFQRPQAESLKSTCVCLCESASRRPAWRALALMAGPLALGVAGVAAYNWARFGSPLDTGYRTAAWDVPVWVGLFGLLFSPGKGLLWYCPPVMLGVAGLVPLVQRRGRTVMLMVGSAVLYLLAHAIYNHWHGGGSWGPRLILPVIPLLMLPVAEWLQCPPRRAWGRLALAFLLAVGLIVQLPAVLVNPARTLQALYDQSASPTEYTLRMLYRPVASPLANQWHSLLEVAALMRDPASRAAVVEMARSAEEQSGLVEAVGLLSFNTFDLWPVYWGLLGAPAWPMLAVEVVLAGAAIWVAWRLRRVAR